MSSHKPVRLMTPDEAAGSLSVSTRTLKRLVAEGTLDAQAQVTDIIPELADSGWRGASVQQVLETQEMVILLQ